MIRTRTRRKLLKKIETATTRGRTLVLKTLLRQSLGIMSSSRDVGKPARKKRTVVCKACGKLLAFKMGLSSDPQRPKTSLTSLPSALTLPLSKLRTPLKSVFLAFNIALPRFLISWHITATLPAGGTPIFVCMSLSAQITLVSPSAASWLM